MSGGVIAVRLLHDIRESLSQFDDSSANRPWTYRVDWSACLSGRGP